MAQNPIHLSDPVKHDRLLHLREIMELTALSRATIYRMIAVGEFPEPTKFGTASRWPASELVEFIKERKAARTLAGRRFDR